MPQKHKIIQKKPAPAEQVIDQFHQYHHSPANKVIHFVSVPFITFAALGLIWAIPFPHLDFLGRYNGFVNWASFVIAFTVYYYYKVSPLLSYGILLLVFAFSAGIVSLEKLHDQNGWPEMWQVCLGVFALAWIAQFAGHRLEKNAPSGKYSMITFLNGPLWFFYVLFKKVGLLR